jgi:hypothetical protein
MHVAADDLSIHLLHGLHLVVGVIEFLTASCTVHCLPADSIAV